MDLYKNIIEIENTVWYPVSLFYARNNWTELSSAVKTFYAKNKALMNHFSVSMSSFQGERLNIVIASSKEKKEILYNKINEEFNHFLLSNPSVKEDNFPYGKEMWRNYDNNSLEWNRFTIPRYILHDSTIRDVLQSTSLLILDLYDDDSDYEDNIVMLLTFLWLKIYKFSLSNSERKTIDKRIKDANQQVEENLKILNQYYLYLPEGTTACYYDEWCRIIEEIYKKAEKQEVFNMINSSLVSLLGCNSELRFQISKLLSEWNTFVKN